MANNLTNAEERRLLDSSLDGTYLCLFTADPTEAGTLTSEIATGSYARVLVEWNAAATDGGGATTKVMTADEPLAPATADWGAISHFGFASAATAGTLRWSAPLDVTKTVLNGDTYVQKATDTIASLN